MRERLVDVPMPPLRTYEAQKKWAENVADMSARAHGGVAYSVAFLVREEKDGFYMKVSYLLRNVKISTEE